ncbi:hypothetical protein A3E97_04760 [Candidatus Uhrbacteria bacterium RIFCSPHIGHO2_12_FULL_47_12]|uniref:Uncharacterized protein n=1 Tax=Candidatus Uhrbacteria bacterium RIFCSPLOWO2_02_FULL_48_18 TaxID=1802408 RepID=A0A1F7V838_9BACT|nr:MAG: hypothetical protein A3E97_04760 [Candidatus Uhrbacteria bacterium RIFCSPHIGHO2_12_FULL_47_12]OGL82242.1 MAG: hypothetical protein A3B20_00625 [Candidatus Uhrbacteria bacterium RIFCSPLOWO2_01_FULL_47_17]OGL86732.1 MAG: hypothetical protein A3I41_05390 [Candidatus Uhrbacteria bacterium RIFCSPLOWO2_02_FULL_48_18]OGL94395.1 MAG: hypothetical protein A3H12_03180 [Candidatus Uhrbacteria bacterium RIFCSPLOWO2_12_FULL_47_9]
MQNFSKRKPRAVKKETSSYARDSSSCSGQGGRLRRGLGELRAAGLAGTADGSAQVGGFVHDDDVLVAFLVVRHVGEVAVQVDHVRVLAALVVGRFRVVDDHVALRRLRARPDVHVEAVVAGSVAVGLVPDTQFDLDATRDHTVSVRLEAVAEMDVDLVDLRVEELVAVTLAGGEIETDHVQRAFDRLECVDPLAQDAFDIVAVGRQGGDETFENTVRLQGHGELLKRARGVLVGALHLLCTRLGFIQPRIRPLRSRLYKARNEEAASHGREHNIP